MLLRPSSCIIGRHTRAHISLPRRCPVEKTAVKTLTTDRELRALRPTDRRQEYRDSEIRNLRVRVTQSGLISFALLVRPDRGNASRRRLGDYGRIEDGVFKAGGLSLKEARKLATIWNAKFQTGIDPRQEFRAALELKRAEKVKGVTLAIIASDYLSTRVLKKRAASSPLRRPKEIQQQLKFFTDAWPTKAANSITADDIEILLEPKAEKHPAMARNLFATLRALYNWAGRKRSYRPLANPCDGFDLEILGAKANRTRTLNHDELRLLARNLRRLSAPFGTLYRTLLLTGLRLNEAARAKWTEFDFENKVWEIPSIANERETSTHRATYPGPPGSYRFNPQVEKGNLCVFDHIRQIAGSRDQ